MLENIHANAGVHHATLKAMILKSESNLDKVKTIGDLDFCICSFRAFLMIDCFK